MGRISSLLCMDLCPLKNTRREGRITRTYTYGEIARSKWNVLCKVQQLQFHCVKEYAALFCSESRAINPPGLTYECDENTFPFSWHPKQSSRTKFELWKREAKEAHEISREQSPRFRRTPHTTGSFGFFSASSSLGFIPVCLRMEGDAQV